MAEQLHPEETVTSIVLLRHGHTKQTESGLLYTDPSAVLTEKGLKQANAACLFLSKENPQILLASTALRVTATAEILSQAINLPVTLKPGLDEQNVGEWEGRSYLDIKKSEPDLYKQWSADPIRNRAPGGESIEDLLIRVKIAMAEIVSTYKGKKIVLVTHAGVIRSAVLAALEMPVDNFYRVSIQTGSISKIDYSDNFACLQYLGWSFE